MHNHLKKMAILMREGNLLAGDKVGGVRVLHDDWCQIHRLGECNCDPDVSFEEVTPEDRERIVEEWGRDLREFQQDIRNKMN